MSFTVHDGYLTSGEELITFSTFKELTGCNVDLTKRIGTEIVTTRRNGHVYLHDTEFVVGEYYKCDRGTYKCEHVNAARCALLVPKKNKINSITSTEPLAFRIVT